MAEAVLTNEEKARIRYHLGYPQTDPVASIQLGVPGFGEPQYLVERAMERIPDYVIGIVRNLVQILDRTEANIIDAQEYLPARKAGEVEINPDHIRTLRTEYATWARRLADTLGAPINQFAAAFQVGGGAMPLNIPVIH